MTRQRTVYDVVEACNSATRFHPYEVLDRFGATHWSSSKARYESVMRYYKVQWMVARFATLPHGRHTFASFVCKTNWPHVCLRVRDSFRTTTCA